MLVPVPSLEHESVSSVYLSRKSFGAIDVQPHQAINDPCSKVHSQVRVHRKGRPDVSYMLELYDGLLFSALPERSPREAV